MGNGGSNNSIHTDNENREFFEYTLQSVTLDGIDAAGIISIIGMVSFFIPTIKEWFWQANRYGGFFSICQYLCPFFVWWNCVFTGWQQTKYRTYIYNIYPKQYLVWTDSLYEGCICNDDKATLWDWL